MSATAPAWARFLDATEVIRSLGSDLDHVTVGRPTVEALIRLMTNGARSGGLPDLHACHDACVVAQRLHICVEECVG
jgi:hypothetical protein